jgi:trimethylamine:corrinoid methyltransferase-like protein
LGHKFGTFAPVLPDLSPELVPQVGRGGKDATARAGEIWRSTVEACTPPPLDDAIRAELDDYVAHRRRELGD